MLTAINSFVPWYQLNVKLQAACILDTSLQQKVRKSQCRPINSNGVNDNLTLKNFSSDAFTFKTHWFVYLSSKQLELNNRYNDKKQSKISVSAILLLYARVCSHFKIDNKNQWRIDYLQHAEAQKSIMTWHVVEYGSSIGGSIGGSGGGDRPPPKVVSEEFFGQCCMPSVHEYLLSPVM